MNNLTIRIKSSRLFSANEMLVLLLLLLSFVDFKLYSLHLMVIAFFVFCINKHRLSAGYGFFSVLMFTIALILFWPGSFLSPTAWMKRVVWPLAYLLGYNFVQPGSLSDGSVTKMEKRAQICFKIAAFGFFGHILLNVYINIGVDGIYRNTIDFWSGQSRAATGQAGLMAIPMAWCVSRFFRNNRTKEKIVAFIALAVMLYYNLSLGSRTIVMVLIVLFCIAVIYMLLVKQNVKKKARLVFAVAVAGIIGIFLFSIDIAGVRSIIEESVLSERLLSGDFSVFFKDGRWKAKWQYLQLMPDYLFGGSNIRRSVGQYAHDVLLDTYDEASIFAFFAVIAMLWDGIAKLMRFLKCDGIEINTKLTVLCIYAVLYIEFCIEPIFAGMPWLLMAFCFFHGIISSLYRNVLCLKCVNGKRA